LIVSIAKIIKNLQYSWLKIPNVAKDLVGRVLLKTVIAPCVDALYIIKEYAVPIKIISTSGTIFNVFSKVRFMISNNSAIRLKEGGAAILDISTRNHNKGKEMLHPNTPFVSKRLREWFAWYIKYAIINIAEEVAPWASIIINAPEAPEKLFNLSAAINNPIWLTEEYAIIIFKSLNRRHKILTKIAPIKEIDIQMFIIFKDLLIWKNSQIP